jgi:hypothetical protein
VVYDEGDFTKSAIDSFAQLDEGGFDEKSIDDVFLLVCIFLPEVVESSSWVEWGLPPKRVRAETADSRPRLIAIIINTKQFCRSFRIIIKPQLSHTNLQTIPPLPSFSTL